jgi:putative ABC transport system permease protein
MRKTNQGAISFKIALFLAWKNVIKNKNKALLTILIISLGFISSIIVDGVLQDTGYKLEQDFIDTSFGDVILEPFEKNDKIKGVNNILKKIESIPYVEGASVLTKANGRLYDSRGGFIDTQILIVNPEDFEKASLIKSMLNEGDYLTENGKNNIFMGCLNLKSCSTFSDSTPNIDVDIGKIVLANFNNGVKANLTLIGSYKHSLATVENINIMSESTAKRLFSDYNEDTADAIIIRLQNRDLAQEAIQELAFLGIDARISDYKEKLAFYSQTVESFNIVGDLSFLIGVIVSAISVYIIIYINALNKKVQIGIMKAIGLKSIIISLSYAIQGLFYGILGSILGIGLTYLMILYFTLYPIQSSIGNLIPRVSISIFILVSIAIILSSTLTGYIASRRIIKKNILESISNE